MDKARVTERINTKALELLEKHPDGLRWSELLSKIKASDPSFHPKTVNGCVWKLVKKFPDKVYKPSKGLFRLLKYESEAKTCSRGHKYFGKGPCPICWPASAKVSARQVRKIKKLKK